MSRDLPRATLGQTTLPSYAHPPLTEVLLAVDVATPLTVNSERLAEHLGPVWMRTSSGDSLSYRSVLGDQRLNARPNGLDLVWDGRTGETYPHYETLRDAFLSAFDAWGHAAGEGDPVPSRWQIAYRNRFPRGTVWHQLDDLRFCRLLTAVKPTPLSGQLQGFKHVWEYRLENPPGLMSCVVTLVPSNTSSDEDDAIWLELSCRANCRFNAEGEWLADLDAARRVIVETFRESMSPEANAYWGMLG
ncbi:MAG TPA: hypothetical protein VFG20_11755 [Planctomycetaceae bacterium]|nr:hypothetical protein [Planctomycetaceae bacterium]